MSSVAAQLYYYEKGHENNQEVVLLHGLLGTARNLHRLAETIAFEGYRVWAIDQRGHGHSPHTKSYSIGEMSDDLIEFLTLRHIHQPILVGHSMGARVSLHTAARLKSTVRGLVLLDAGMQINPVGLGEVRKIVESLPEEFQTKEQVESFFSSWPPPLKQFLISNLRTRDEKQKWVFDLVGLREGLLSHLAIDQRQSWLEVACPSLVVRGDRSTHFTEAEVDEMLKLNTHANRATVANAGHWLHVDNFDGTCSVILTFLGGIQTL